MAADKPKAIKVTTPKFRLSFPNLDPFHHHVYSFSKAKTFELKLYSRDETRRVTFDNTRLFWHYMVAQGIAGIALVHLIPRLGGGL